MTTEDAMNLCPFHAKLEEDLSKASVDRTKIWEYTEKKLSFKVFYAIITALITIGVAALGAQYIMISGFTSEVKADITLIRNSQYELKDYVKESILEIKYSVKSLANKHESDWDKHLMEFGSNKDNHAMEHKLFEEKIKSSIHEIDDK
jgi:ABC-type lipoprotein release transport system permease subunit